MHTLLEPKNYFFELVVLTSFCTSAKVARTVAGVAHMVFLLLRLEYSGQLDILKS